ncbi:MAG TPA: FAD-dependent oxidoreductase, partial [Caldilinea sp.]|nr:FAD-dependent oxidoreductase [Caldilinea sp.]
LDNFPVFNCLVDEGRFYGFPVFGVPGFKFGKYHHFEEQGRPHEIKRGPSREDEEMLRDFAARYFPHATGPTMTLKECMFTNAPDGHFIVDLHPDLPQVSFASACSGHGYKFASVIGEILADLAERRQSRHDISLFALSRFGGRPSKIHREKLELIERGLPAGEGHPGYGSGKRQLSMGNGQRSIVNGRSGEYGSAWEDTADPRYWQAGDVTPFW